MTLVVRAEEHTAAVVVVLDDAVLWQPDADTGERDADAEADTASGADVADDLGPKPWAPPDAAAEPQPDAPEGAGRRVHGVPTLVPAQHPLYDHLRLHRRHRDLRQRQRQRQRGLNNKEEDKQEIRGRTCLVPSARRMRINDTGLRRASAAVEATGFGSVGGGGGGWWIWWGSGISSVGCCGETRLWFGLKFWMPQALSHLTIPTDLILRPDLNIQDSTHPYRIRVWAQHCISVLSLFGPGYPYSSTVKEVLQKKSVSKPHKTPQKESKPHKI